MVMIIKKSLILVLLVQLLFPSAQALDYFTRCDSSPSYYAQNSQYQKNLDILLANLTSQASLSGVHYHSLGQTPDQVYGLFLCRGDIGSLGCNQCVDQAQDTILKECPNKIWAAQWYDNCMLRFSNEPFYHDMGDNPSHGVWNPQIVPSKEAQVVHDVLNRTMIELAPQVANNIVKFGTKVVNATNSLSFYTLGQCMLDLSVDDCHQCLKIAIAQLLVWPVVIGARYLLPSCNFRFETYPFYGNSVNTSFFLSSTINSTEEVTREKHKGSSHIAIAVSIPVVVVVLVVVGAYLICTYNRKAATSSLEPEEINSVDSLQYDFDEIRIATENFSMENKLGEGGFGVVYKGKFQNGREIAVKRLSINSGQGVKEYKTEVVLVAKLQHKNLVRLLGYCLHAQEKLLVYEFLPNSSLDKVLLDHNKKKILDWETRYRIIAGIARGLLYLHEDSRLKIIHRDLKSSNIMLDESMNPKISDFGLARLVGIDQIQDDTNRIVGTQVCNDRAIISQVRCI